MTQAPFKAKNIRNSINWVAMAMVLPASQLSAAVISNVLDTNINTAAGWSDGATTGFPTSADTVTFDKDGTWASAFNTAMSWGGNVTVSHATGTLSGTNIFYSEVASGFTWNVSGTGAINAGDDIYFRGPGSWDFGSGSTLESKGLQLVTNAGAEVTFQSGSSTTLAGRDTYAVRFNNAASTLNWHGGSTSFNGTDIFRFQTATGTVDIAGDFAFTGSNVVNLFDTTGGIVNFNDTWTGSFELNSGFTAIAIEAELISSGATYNGVDIDGTNISNFSISNGSIALVPEPSSAALLGLGALGLVLRRRRA